jgi:hypothetical protein
MATDNVGNEESPPMENGQIKPDTVTTIGHSTMSLVKGLSMVALPVVPEERDPQKLIGFTNNRWARWNPATGAYARYPDAPAFFDDNTPGKGYWVMLDESKMVSVPGTPADPRSPFKMTLKKGWNQIGSPFLSPVIWDVNAVKVSVGNEEKTLLQAKAAGWVENFAWGWQSKPDNTGSYVLVYDSRIIPNVSNTLEPWHGYWFKANVDCDLILPPPVSANLSRTLTRRRQSPNNWMVMLSAESGGAKDSIFLGVSSEARGDSKMQIAKPPAAPGQGNLQLFLVAPEKQARMGVDVRRSVADKEAWHIVVKGDQPNQDVTLRWSDMGTAPRSLRFYLVDEATGKRRYMRTTSGYTFRTGTGGGEKKFRIELDTTPSGRLLTHLNVVNNGASGGALFSLVLSQPATVNARIITPTGKVAAVVAHGAPAKQGLNTFVWNGKAASGAALPRGVYFVEVTAVTEEGQEIRDVRTFALR